MLLASIRRLALGDLDEDTLRELVEHGEDLLVERKRALPNRPGFGAAAASFANTLGGWILLGVGDDKTLHGYAKPPNLDLQSHLASVLRNECDPLPPFVAEMFELDGKPIAVLRVFESTDPPHIVRGTGAVYVRSSKGKEPVDDHRTLLELARRGREAEERARARLVGLSLIQKTLVPPDTPYRRTADPDHAVVHVRAAPMTVTPQFADWPISDGGGAHACAVAVEELIPSGPGPARVGPAQVAPAARGAIARKSGQVNSVEGPWSALAVTDSGGVVAATLRRPTKEGDWESPENLRRSMIRPLLDATVKMLSTAEAYGRAAFDTWICVPADLNIEGGRLRGTSTTREIYISGELTIPADDDEVGALASQWEREFARHFDIKQWED
jgi:hypothetical protein